MIAARYCGRFGVLCAYLQESIRELASSWGIVEGERGDGKRGEKGGIIKRRGLLVRPKIKGKGYLLKISTGI